MIYPSPGKSSIWSTLLPAGFKGRVPSYLPGLPARFLSGDNHKLYETANVFGFYRRRRRDEDTAALGQSADEQEEEIAMVVRQAKRYCTRSSTSSSSSSSSGSSSQSHSPSILSSLQEHPDNLCSSSPTPVRASLPRPGMLVSPSSSQSSSSPAPLGARGSQPSSSPERRARRVDPSTVAATSATASDSLPGHIGSFNPVYYTRFVLVSS